MGTSAYTVKSTVGVERDRLDRYICLDMSTVGVERDRLDGYICLDMSTVEVVGGQVRRIHLPRHEYIGVERTGWTQWTGTSA